MITLSHTNKPSKKKAFETILKRKQGEELTDYEIDELINYFSPRVTKPKTALQWVAKAVAKKDCRYYLNHVCVEDGVAYGSDGHRIHYIDTSLADGCYDPKTLLKVELDDYPFIMAKSIKRCIPVSSHLHLSVTALTKEIKDMDHVLKAITKAEHPSYYLESYINDAMGTTENMRYGEDYEVLFGSHKFGSFIIMSRRYKDNI